MNGRTATQTNAAPTGPGPDVDRCANVAVRLRRTFGALVATVPEEHASVADMSRYLDVGRNICQRVRLALNADGDPLNVLQRFPGVDGLTQFLEAARRRGLSEDKIAGARAALDDYAALIGAAGGSQRRLIATIEARKPASKPDERAAPDGDEQLATREAFYEAARALTGSHCEARVEVLFLRPRPGHPDEIDMLEASGIVGAAWRADSLPIARVTRGEDHAGFTETLRTEVDTPEPVLGISPGSLLDAFSTKPLPSVASRTRLGELVQVFNPRGGASERPIDIVVGTAMSPAAAHPRLDDPPIWNVGMVIGMPCRWLLMDVYMERSLARASLPTMSVVRMGFTGPLGNRHPDDRWYDLLPPPPTIEMLGVGLHARPTPAYPRAHELASHLLGRAGWDEDRFIGVRCAVPFPIWEMQYVMCFDFGEDDAPRR